MAPPRKYPVGTKPGRTPLNQSRAAGQAAPKSAASTAPMEGAHGDFYSPGDSESPNTPRAGFKTEFINEVRHNSMPIEQGGSVDREVAEHLASDAIEDSDVLAAEIARIRATRKPIGAYSQKLALPKRSGYHRHWFNDTAGRVGEAKNNGWTHITGTDGKPIARCVGTGRDKGALYAYAMEIPEVFWLEDMAARNQAATDKVDALKASPFQAKAGQAQSSDNGKFYDPTGEGPLQVTRG